MEDQPKTIEYVDLLGDVKTKTTFTTTNSYTVGETVTLDLFKSGRIPNCVIKSVTFLSDNRVTYSVRIPTGEDSFVTINDIGFIYLLKQD